MYIFAFHPKFPASPFSHYGQPPRAESTPSAQDSHPERRIVWEISLEAEKQRESGKGLVHGNDFMQSALKWKG